MSGSKVFRNGITVERCGTLEDCARSIGVSSAYLRAQRLNGEMDVEAVARMGSSTLYIIEEVAAWLQRKRWASTRRNTSRMYGGSL